MTYVFRLRHASSSTSESATEIMSEKGIRQKNDLIGLISRSTFFTLEAFNAQVRA